MLDQLRILLPLLLCISPQLIGPMSAAAADAPIAIGDRRELFIDHHLIDKMNNTRLVLNRPRDEGVVLKFDKPWEGLFCGYCTIIKDGDLYRAYYRGRPKAGHDGDENEVYCCAESKDGHHWTKPELDLFPRAGHAKTNIVLANAAPITHNLSPMLDTRPGVPTGQRYKAFGGTVHSGLVAMCSADGLEWQKMQEEPVIAKNEVPYRHMFDSQNVVFWSAQENKYISYFRVFEDGIRRIVRSTSDDFLNWTPCELMKYRHNGKRAPLEHLYTNQTHAYFRAPHLYVAVAARFMPGRQVLNDEQAKAINVHPKYFRDTSDAVLLTTRGGDTYDRTFMSGFIRPGIGPQNWISRTNYPALNVVQTGPDEMSVYVNQDYAQPTSHLRRYSLRLDGFASAQASHAGGELITKPLTFTGNKLSLNFGTSAAGGVQVEIQDSSGEPIAGYSLNDAVEQIGNEIDRVVSWKNGSDVSDLAGRPVRLRFVIKDADVYAFKFNQ